MTQTDQYFFNFFSNYGFCRFNSSQYYVPCVLLIFYIVLGDFNIADLLLVIIILSFYFALSYVCIRLKLYILCMFNHRCVFIRTFIGVKITSK